MKVPNIYTTPSIQLGVFALVAFIVAYYFGSRTGKATATQGKYSNEISGNQLTYENSRYGSLADRLQVAMGGFADDEEAIYAVFAQMRTKSDVLQTIKAFGNRRIPFTIGSANLGVFLNYRLSKSEVEKINEILSRNNIDYKF